MKKKEKISSIIKMVAVDIILSTSLILNLIKPNIYNSFLLKFVSIITIGSSILGFLCYILIYKAIDNKEIKNKKIEDLKNNFLAQLPNNLLFEIYDNITDALLIVLFIVNGFVWTALTYLLTVMYKQSLVKKINKLKEENKNKEK